MTRLILLIICGFFIAHNAQADCQYQPGSSYGSQTINFGTVYVQRDSTPGTVLAEVNTGFQTSNYYGCNTAWTYRWEYTMFTTPNAIGSGVYETNIKGVGIKVTNTTSGSTIPYDLPKSPSSKVNYVYTSLPRNLTAQLVKTTTEGAASGPLSQGAFAKASAAGVAYFGELRMGTANIVPVACAITTPSLNFPIGDILASRFGSAPGTIPAGGQSTQNLGLNCDANANINVTLRGTQNPDVSTTSVLALSGQGSAGVASGVGVQLLYNGAPLTLNSKVILKKSAGGQETFPLVARYYQTRTSVTTGKANTSATLDLTYQ